MFKRSVFMMIAVLVLTLTAAVPAFAADNAPTDNHTGAECKYGGWPYSEGAYVMQAGKLMKCVDGKWVEYIKSAVSTGSNAASPASASSATIGWHLPASKYSTPTIMLPASNYSGTAQNSYSR